MIIAIIGSTGLVGTEIIKILEKQKQPKISKVLFVSSKKSVGKKIYYKKKPIEIIAIEKAIEKKPTYALFSAGSETALNFAKEFTKTGTVVIDNSSAFRMDKNIKLIVPEINKNKITKKDKIIANPNCSTIQLVLAISKIHQQFNIKRLVVSTYQAVSGSGNRGVNQLKNEEQKKITKTRAYKKNIHRNIIPKCDDFLQNGYTKEEEKIIKETNKILNSKIKITATAVRVPTLGGHGESVNIELKKQATTEEIKKILKKQEGVVFEDGEKYKTPQETKERNEVFISRVRKDCSVKNGFNMWVVADPLRKGAATNAIQILNHLINTTK